MHRLARALTTAVLSVFSILDTGDGTITSYVFDTRDPFGEVRPFARFVIGQD